MTDSVRDTVLSLSIKSWISCHSTVCVHLNKEDSQRTTTHTDNKEERLRKTKDLQCMMTHALASTTLTDFPSVSGHFTRCWDFSVLRVASFVLNDWHYRLSAARCVTSKSSLVTFVTDDEPCHFFFGHVWFNCLNLRTRHFLIGYAWFRTWIAAPDPVSRLRKWSFENPMLSLHSPVGCSRPQPSQLTHTQHSIQRNENEAVSCKRSNCNKIRENIVKVARLRFYPKTANNPRSIMSLCIYAHLWTFIWNTLWAPPGIRSIATNWRKNSFQAHDWCQYWYFQNGTGLSCRSPDYWCRWCNVDNASKGEVRTNHFSMVQMFWNYCWRYPQNKMKNSSVSKVFSPYLRHMIGEIFLRMLVHLDTSDL